MQSYQLDRIAQKGVSKATGDHPHNSGDHIPVSEETFSYGINDHQNTYEKCRLNPLEYSQVAPVYVKGPSTTSTPMVRHSGGNVNPDCRVENEPLKESEQQDWRNEFKTIASDIVYKTNEVLLKTLSEHDQYTKSKDLFDEEMAEMRHDLEFLRPSHSDTVTPKTIVTASVTLGMSSVDRLTGSKYPITHQNRIDSIRWVLDTTGQPIFIPLVTE